MIEYEMIFSEEYDTADSDMIESINNLIAGWNTDELIELLGECEWILSSNEERLEQLDIKGFRLLCHIITGINRKNKQTVRRNMHEIQKISLAIQKIILKRIDLVSAAVRSLNDKVNEQTFWTLDIINNLYQKIEKRQRDTEIMSELLMWHNTVKNHTVNGGKKYIELSDGRKILLVVSDVFRIAHERGSIIKRSFLESTLQNLNICDQINCFDFYETIIYEKECLSLYIREEYDYTGSDISTYGKTIYKIYEFYKDPHLLEVSKSMNIPLESMCIQTIRSNVQEEKIRTVDLCQTLLNDLILLNSDYQIKIKEQIRLEMEATQEENSDMVQKPSSVSKEGKMEEKEKIEYSILRLMPEELRMFKENRDIYNKLDYKNNYTFSSEKAIKTCLDSLNPYMIAIPTGYFYECIPEIKDILTSKTKVCLSLADYYMYLWFHNISVDKRKNHAVAMVEYYNHKLYVSGYSMDDSGDSYQKGFSKLIISHNRSVGTIIREIMSQKFFSDLSKDKVTIFKTFYADKRINKKLEDKGGIEMVCDTWENSLKTNEEELKKTINDIMEKSESF